MRSALLLLPLLVGSASVGCRGGADRPGIAVMPEMFHSVPYDAHDPNGVLPRGQTLQPAPLGTVSRGFSPTHYAPGPEEALRAGRELTNPLPANAMVVRAGARLFASNCAVCHGPQGAGDGPIVPPFPNPPALSANHAKQLPDGQVFHIITHGQGIMPPHGRQITPEDRWRIVLFVRWLQDPNVPRVAAPGGGS
ncbi:MAG: cytochrome c [Deltaproteobacteria bacterium]|nr:cytochrome c [Deltaproteobacteria bacterium]